jgi:ribonuclease HI
MSKNTNDTNYYAIHKGYTTGIYNNWEECKKNVDGFINPIYKKFKTLEEAEYFMENGYDNKTINKIPKNKPSILDFLENIDTEIKNIKKNNKTDNTILDIKKNIKKDNTILDIKKDNTILDIKKDINLEKDIINPNYYQKEFMYIFCDGSSLQKNYKSIRCGYGVYLVKPDGQSLEFSKLVDNTGTNNVAELSAILHGLNLLESIQSRKVLFISDSTYAINSITVWGSVWKKNNWQTSSKKPVENLEIIKEAIGKYESLINNGYQIIFKHIMSHKKQPSDIKSYEYFLWYGNDITDQLAKYGEIKTEYKKPELKS